MLAELEVVAVKIAFIAGKTWPRSKDPVIGHLPFRQEILNAIGSLVNSIMLAGLFVEGIDWNHDGGAVIGIAPDNYRRNTVPFLDDFQIDEEGILP